MLVISSSFANYSGAFPAFTAVNVSAPSAGDGTEFIANLVNDGIWGWQQALMSRAGMTPNGVVESASASQMIDAFKKAYAIGPGIGVTYWKTSDPSIHGDRVLLLQGQLIEISSYTELVDATYCGDGTNATASAFYKCDSGGTRSTSGAYMRLPDSRAVELCGIGSQTINTRVKTGPADRGGILEDQTQGSQIGGTIGGAEHYLALTSVNSINSSTAGGAGPSVVIAGTKSYITGVYSGIYVASKDDGTNGTPRTGTYTRGNLIGVNFGITY